MKGSPRKGCKWRGVIGRRVIAEASMKGSPRKGCKRRRTHRGVRVLASMKGSPRKGCK